MKIRIGFLLVIWPVMLLAKENDNRKLFFLNLAKLEFDSAKVFAAEEDDSRMRFEMVQLADILFYEGQRERSYFTLTEGNPTDQQDLALSFMRALNTGYVSLFYDRSKVNAYNNFYQAYQLAKEINNPSLIKASLLAFFKYHKYEIAQVSDSYKK